jgi:chemotaxis protein MotB
VEVSPIIIIRKKKGHGGHHGGAWKVAYADFVTAMMALFIVLWLMNASKPVQEAVGGYFRDPKGSTKNMGTNKTPSPAHESPKNDEMVKLKAQLEESIRRLDPQNKLGKQIEITITPEGLRIELMESAQGTFFESGSPAPTPALRSLLEVLSAELGKLPNKRSIEGHTDSIVYSSGQTYDNWDLSSGRANEARRLMWAKGVSPQQIAQVRGFADRQPRLPQHPEDPSNRRVTLIVQNEARDGSQAPIPASIPMTNAAAPGKAKSGVATGPTPVRAGQ